MPESLRIPSRFNGPRGSGNGGYSAGVVAGLLGGEAEVNLRRPVPLDTPLRVVREDGDAVQVLDGDALVADGRTAEADVEPPAPVSLDDARRASRGYRGSPDNLFSGCFVCGKARGNGDSFGIFAGAVEGRGLVASPWRPPVWSGDQSGRVRPEFVWAALDCPTYFAAYMGEESVVSFLVRFTVRVEAGIRTDAEHVVIAWPIEAEGRKRQAGSALLSAEGETLAVAGALLVEPRPG